MTSQQPRQQLGILAISLHPVARRPRRLARRRHQHVHPAAAERASPNPVGPPSYAARTGAASPESQLTTSSVQDRNGRDAARPAPRRSPQRAWGGRAHPTPRMSSLPAWPNPFVWGQPEPISGQTKPVRAKGPVNLRQNCALTAIACRPGCQWPGGVHAMAARRAAAPLSRAPLRSRRPRANAWREEARSRGRRATFGRRRWTRGGRRCA